MGVELADVWPSVGVALVTAESLVGVDVAEADVLVGCTAVLISLITELMAEEAALAIEPISDVTTELIELRPDVTAEMIEERGSTGAVVVAELAESEEGLEVIVAALELAPSVGVADELSVLDTEELPDVLAAEDDALTELAESDVDALVDAELDALSEADALDETASEVLAAEVAVSVEVADEEDESVAVEDVESVLAATDESVGVGVAAGSSTVEVAGTSENTGSKRLSTASPTGPTIGPSKPSLTRFLDVLSTLMRFLWVSDRLAWESPWAASTGTTSESWRETQTKRAKNSF